jgi:hypothetical protein
MTAAELIARLTPPTAIVGPCIKCQGRGVIIRGDVFINGRHQSVLWHPCGCAAGDALYGVEAEKP